MATNKQDKTGSIKEAGKKMMERIRKLLRMADDVSSPNEAAIAARRAERLMAEYNLTNADMLTAGLSVDDLDAKFAGPQLKRLPRWADVMACSVAEYADCHVRKERFPGTVKLSLRFLGEANDLEVCIYVWTYLCRTVNRLCEESGCQYIGDRNSFRMGAASEIAKTMRRMKAEDRATDVETSDGKSLVLVNKKHQLMKQRFGVTIGKYSKSKSSIASDGAYAAGKEAGRGVTIRKAVNSGRNTRRIGHG